MKNPLLWVVVAVLVVGLFSLGVKHVIIEKTTDRVIERLKQEYDPSPYDPGFDPDKVNVDAIKKVFFPTNTIEEKGMAVKADWLTEWEQARGFSR